MDVQGTKCRRNIADNLNRLSTAHERYRRQTDGRAIAYSEREREFTFAKKPTFFGPFGGCMHFMFGKTSFASAFLHFF